MIIYIADNNTTGERIISHSKEEFDQMVADFERGSDIVTDSFDISDENVIRILESNKVNAVLQFIKDRNLMFEVLLEKLRRTIGALQTTATDPRSEVLIYKILKYIDLIEKGE